MTEGTGLAEIIGRYDAGWTAQTSTEAIAEAIEQAILARHMWSEKSRNARRLIAENYLWEKVAAETGSDVLSVLDLATNGAGIAAWRYRIKVYC